jgi:protein-tyrosine phosphatase
VLAIPSLYRGWEERRSASGWITMRYGLLFIMLGALVAMLAAVIGGAGWMLLWPALSFTVVGVAYVRRRPSMLGKRADGTRVWWALALLAPYFLLTWLTWHVERMLSRENVADEISPDVWVGRRPFVHELPPGVRVVVDLTAEFAAAPAVRRHVGDVSAPVLDGTAPEAVMLRELLDRLRDEEGILFHCASGHGRSATLAAALMISRGLAANVEQAEAEARRRRPGIRMNAAQRALLRTMFARPT